MFTMWLKRVCRNNQQLMEEDGGDRHKYGYNNAIYKVYDVTICNKLVLDCQIKTKVIFIQNKNYTVLYLVY